MEYDLSLNITHVSGATTNSLQVNVPSNSITLSGLDPLVFGVSSKTFTSSDNTLSIVNSVLTSLPDTTTINVGFKIDNINLADITESNKNTIINDTKQLYATQLGISADLIEITLSQGSIIVDVVITLEGLVKNNISTVNDIQSNINANKSSILNIVSTETGNTTLSVDDSYAGSTLNISDNGDPDPDYPNLKLYAYIGMLLLVQVHQKIYYCQVK
jgi:hypothetical protein